MLLTCCCTAASPGAAVGVPAGGAGAVDGTALVDIDGAARDVDAGAIALFAPPQAASPNTRTAAPSHLVRPRQISWSSPFKDRGTECMRTSKHPPAAQP